MSNPGNLSICQTCAYQERVQEEEQEDRCIHPQPVTDDQLISCYRPLPAQDMGERLGELYEMVYTLSQTTLELAEALELHLEFESEEQP